MDPFELFETYGTHYLSSLVIGGRLVFSSVTDRRSFESEYSLEVLAEMSFSTKCGEINKSSSTNEDSSEAAGGIDNKNVTAEDTKKFEEQSKIQIKATGGDARYVQDVISHYTDWADSVKNYPAFVDFKDKNSLQPIWKLASTLQRKTQLESMYNDFCEQRQYKIQYSKPPFLYGKWVQMTKKYDDVGSGAWKDVVIGQPNVDFQNGWYCLGQTAYQAKTLPSINCRALVVKEIVPGILASIDNWTKIWSWDTLKNGTKNFSVWKGQVNDKNFHVIGDFFYSQKAEEPVFLQNFGIKAVHRKCLTTTVISIDYPAWTDYGSRAKEDISLWDVTVYEPNDEERFNPFSEVSVIRSILKLNVKCNMFYDDMNKMLSNSCCTFVAGDNYRSKPVTTVYKLKEDAIWFHDPDDDIQ